MDPAASVLLVKLIDYCFSSLRFSFAIDLKCFTFQDRLSGDKQIPSSVMSLNGIRFSYVID